MSSLYTLHEEGLVLRVTVRPGSAQSKLQGVYNYQLKIFLMAPPVNNKANQACKELLAKVFVVSKSDVKYLSGETQRSKKVLIKGSPTQLEEKLKHILEDLPHV